MSSRRAQEPHIVRILQGADQKTLTVDEDDFFVGRDPGLKICIPAANISRKHLRIKITGNQVSIQDLGSSNGTFISGKQLRDHESIVLPSPETECRLGNHTSIFICPGRLLNASAHSEETLAETATGKPEQKARPARTDTARKEIGLELEILELNKNNLLGELKRSEEALKKAEHLAVMAGERRENSERMIAGLQENREELEQDIQDLQARLEELHKEIDGNEKTIQGNRAEIANLQGILTALAVKAEEAREAVRRETAVFDFEIRKNKANIGALDAEMQAGKLAKEVQLAELEARKGAVSMEIRAVQQEHAALAEATNQLKSAADRQVEQATLRLQALENEMQRAQENHNAEMKADEQLRLQITDHQIAVKDLLAERAKLQNEIDSHSEKCNLFLAESESLSAKNAELVRRHEEQLKGNTLAAASFRKIETEAQAAAKALADAQLETLNLQVAIADQQAALLLVQTEHEQKATQLMELQQVLDKEDTEGRLRIEANQRAALLLLQAEQEKAAVQLAELKQTLAEEAMQGRLRIKAEITHLRHEAQVQVDQQFTERGRAMELELGHAREKELAKISRIKTELDQAAQARKNYILDEIVHAAIDLAQEGPLENSEAKFRAAVRSALDGKTSGALTAKAAERTRQFWRKKAILAAIPCAIVVFFLIFPGLPGGIKHMLERKIASENSESGGVFLQEIRQRGLKFQPPSMSRTIRDSYSDNIIYVENYVEMKLDDAEQRQWILLLNDFLVGRLGLSDRVIPGFISAESGMIKDLLEIRVGILPQYKEQGFARMAATEKKGLETILELLQTEENYRKFRALEKSYYLDYISKKKPAN